MEVPKYLENLIGQLYYIYSELKSSGWDLGRNNYSAWKTWKCAWIIKAKY